MTLSETTLHSMRDDLVKGVGRHNRRRRTRRLIGVAVPVIAVAVGVGVLLSNSDGEPAYALTETTSGSIRVEVYPGFDDVTALESSLAEVGLQAVVVHLEAHPSLDGLVEVSSHNNERTGALEFDNGEFVIDPTAVDGEIEILIYSAAPEGHNYQFAPPIFAPGQALAGLPCAYPDGPLSTAELERRAHESGIDNVVWTVFDRQEPGVVGTEYRDQRPDGFVADAQLRNAHTLLVTVVLDLTEPAAETLRMNNGTHPREESHCTPELAAKWD